MNTKLKAGAVAALALALVGCTSQTTRWGNPALFGGAGTADSYQCYKESKQEMGGFDLASTVQADAQRLYDLCMAARGYTK
jgi:hypothetical protein